MPLETRLLSLDHIRECKNGFYDKQNKVEVHMNSMESKLDECMEKLRFLYVLGTTLPDVVYPYGNPMQWHALMDVLASTLIQSF